MRYPIGIEKQLSKLYVNFLKKIQQQFIKKLIKAQNKNLQVDGIEDIENIIKKIIEKIYLSKKLKSQIKNIFQQLNKHTFRETEKFLNDYKKKNKNFYSIQIPENTPFMQNFVERFTKNNIELVQLSGQNYIESVGRLAREAFINGESTKSLSEKYKEFTDRSINKSKFWAQDQLGSAYSYFTQERQTSAGIPGFIWSTSRDNSVRVSHFAVDGKFGTWAVGILVEGIYTFPGRPYRCRCVAKPSFGIENEIQQ